MDDQPMAEECVEMSDPFRPLATPPQPQPLDIPPLSFSDEAGASDAQAFANYVAVGKTQTQAWINELPMDPSRFWSASIEPEYTVEHYRDLLDWAKRNSEIILGSLDSLERRYRNVGLQYHKIPFKVRHTSDSLSRAGIHPMTLARLCQLFETDMKREYQGFFAPWKRLASQANDVVGAVRISQDEMEEAALNAIRKWCEEQLKESCTSLFGIIQTTIAMEQLLDQIYIRMKIHTYPATDLNLKYVTEGAIFRRWVSTLSEVAAGEIDLELLASDMISNGAEQQKCWGKAIN